MPRTTSNLWFDAQTLEASKTGTCYQVGTRGCRDADREPWPHRGGTSSSGTIHSSRASRCSLRCEVDRHVALASARTEVRLIVAPPLPLPPREG
jgi:hypothetical protein